MVASIEKEEQWGKKENMKRRKEEEEDKEKRKWKKNQRQQCYSVCKTEMKICQKLFLNVLKVVLPEKGKYDLHKWQACMLSGLVVSNSCDPMDCSPLSFSVQETLQARLLEWVANSCSSGSCWPRDQTRVPYIGRHIFNYEEPWKPTCLLHVCIFEFHCKKGLPSQRKMANIVHPQRTPGLPPLSVLFPNLFLLHKGVEGCKTTQPPISDMPFGNVWLKFSQT